MNESLLKPNHSSRKVQNALKKKQDTQKENYDRGAKSLPELNQGDQIRVRNENLWESGMVESKADTHSTVNALVSAW